MARLINPRFDFYGPQDQNGYPVARLMNPAQESTLMSTGLHTSSYESLGNYLTAVLFNEYERCMLDIANAIGTISTDNDILTGTTNIGDALTRIRTMYLPLSGGTITGDLTVTKTITAARSQLDRVAVTYQSGFQCIVGDIIMRPNGELYRCCVPVTLPADAVFHTVLPSFQPLVTKNVNYIIVTVADSSIFSIGDPIAYVEGAYVSARSDAAAHCAMGVCGGSINATTMVVVTHGIVSVNLDNRNLQPSVYPSVLYTGYAGGLSYGAAGYPNPIGTVLRAASNGEYDVMVHGGIVNQYIEARSDIFTADGTTSVLTLKERPVGAESMLVVVDGHVLPPSAWTLRSDASFRLATTPSAESIVVVYYTVIYNDKPAQSIRQLSAMTFAPGETRKPLAFADPYAESAFIAQLPSRSVLLFSDGAPMMPATSSTGGDYDIINGDVVLSSSSTSSRTVHGYAIVQNASMTPSERSVSSRHLMPGAIHDTHLSASLRHDLAQSANQIAALQSGYSGLVATLQQMKVTRGIIDAGKVGESTFNGPDIDGTCRAAYYSGTTYCIRGGVLYATMDYAHWSDALIDGSADNNSNIRSVRVCDGSLIVLKSNASSTTIYILTGTVWSSLSGDADMYHVLRVSGTYMLANNSGAYHYGSGGTWTSGAFQARGSDPLTINDLSLTNGKVIATFAAGYCAVADAIGGAFATQSISTGMTLSNIIHDGASYYALGAYTDGRSWGAIHQSDDGVTWTPHYCTAPVTTSGVLGAAAIGHNMLSVFPNHISAVHTSAHELHSITNRDYLPFGVARSIRYCTIITTDEATPRFLVFMKYYDNAAETGLAVYAIQP